VHYEIEIREHERGPDGDPRIVGRRWAAFKAFAADAVPRPLTFDSLEEPLAYTCRNPGIARIVRVADDGGREVVDAAVP
jgi:hypothetical protein